MGKSNNPNHLDNLKDFTSENQPSGEAKSLGKQKKRLLKDLANALISGDRLEKCKLIAEKVGLDLRDNEYTLDVAMTLKQIEKAFDESDTRAYQAAMDRLLGKPKQEIEQTINEIKPLDPKWSSQDFSKKKDANNS